MIALATGKKDLDENLKEHLEDGYIVDSMEFFFANAGNFDTAILSRHLKGTAVIISELLFFLKQSNMRVIYITNEDQTDEIKTCLKLGISDIVFEPVDLYKVKRIVESTVISYSNKPYTNGEKDIENSLYDFYENAFKNEETQENENDMYYFGKGLYENKKDKEVEEAEENKEVVAEKENNEAEVIKSSNTVALSNVQAVKKDNIFVFTLNYIYKLLSLFANLITALIDGLQWIVISVILTAAAYFIFKQSGGDNFNDLLNMVQVYFN